jgi:hypothetical protein
MRRLSSQVVSSNDSTMMQTTGANTFVLNLAFLSRRLCFIGPVLLNRRVLTFDAPLQSRVSARERRAKPQDSKQGLCPQL